MWALEKGKKNREFFARSRQSRDSVRISRQPRLLLSSCLENFSHFYLLHLGWTKYIFSIRYSWHHKKKIPIVHAYVSNESLTAQSSCATKYFLNGFMKNYSSHLYAPFGTFCVQITQSFAEQWVFKHSIEFRNQRNFPSKTVMCRFSNDEIFQWK